MNRIEDSLLGTILQPSRYLGSEFNVARKDPAKVDLRVALAFPDLYDLGLGNLGLHVLYAILNRLPWCWAERVYAPAPDLDAALRKRGEPLFALESRDPLCAMDLIGFSLQSELTYTTVLSMIDAAGLPLRASERVDDNPLVIGGGPCACNPEPLAPFFDAFVVGDGEEVVVEIAETMRDAKGKPRGARCEALARIPGVYVPANGTCGTNRTNGTSRDSRHAPVARRIVRSLDDALAAEPYLVPFAHLVHDRVCVEILRGCTHGCRFCQAGMVQRPLRSRSIEAIDGIVRRTLDDTGYEEVSLLSLSACDYPRIRTLLERVAKQARDGNVAVSLPSLRLDTFSVDLADAISGARRSGLTFAPEAATPRLRSVINKPLDEEQLFEVTAEAIRRGWQHVKYYFMIGLPTETDEDVAAIADLCRRALTRARAVNSRAMIFTGVSTFVPKPFTPFQWSAQIDLEETRRRQDILEDALRGRRGIRFGRHEPASTFVEGLLSRADRRAADLIEAAYRRGARLESSSEHLDLAIWRDAITETGYDVAEAFGERARDVRLPWDFIDAGVDRNYLWREWERACNGEITADCRFGACQGCGIRTFAPDACAAVAREYAAEDAPAIVRPPEPSESVSIQRLRFKIGRRGAVRFLSNLESMSAWTRALRRSGAPLAYSRGFHAHPRVTFATAPPVGEESDADYMDVVLRQYCDPEALLARLRMALPEGLFAHAVEDVPLKASSLMSAVTGFEYVLYSDEDAGALRLRAEALLSASEILVERKGRPTGRRRSDKSALVDLRPSLGRIEIVEDDRGGIAIEFSVRQAGSVLAKPREVVALLGLDAERSRVVKIATYFGANGD